MSGSIDVSRLTRDADYIKKQLYIKDKALYTKQPTYLYFPEHYVRKQLADIADTISVLGIVGLEIAGRYAFINLPAFIDTEPLSVESVTVDDIGYYRLSYESDTVLFRSTTIVKDETYLFELFDEFFLKAKIPWYMDYTDLGRLFDNMQKYTGSRIGNNPAIIEVFTAVISRLPEDRKKPIRHYFNQVGSVTRRPVFVQMESVYYAFENTTSRLVGSYSQDGITASLVDPSEKTERIERLLRA